MLAAQRAVELAQQLGAEAGGQRRARQVDDVADALQADAGERGDGLASSRSAASGSGASSLRSSPAA